MLLLTGANGRTGRAILQALVARKVPVRVFIRKEEQWSSLQKLGALEYAVGDMLDTASINAAVKGCDRVLHIGPPMHAEEVKITDDFIAAAKCENVKHFVYYAVMHPLRREVRHHALKLDAEEHIIDSGLPYTIIEPCRYMQHLEMIWPAVKEQGIHAMAFNVDVQFNVVDLLDLAEATAKVVAEPGHWYATYELAGPESLSQTEMAEIISDVLHKPVKAEAVSLDEMAAKAAAKGMSEDRVQQMRIMNGHYDHYGFLGNANVLRWLLGREPTRFRDYVKRIAA
jgi:uncharacterized protein YbjT (DUF2867 family)